MSQSPSNPDPVKHPPVNDTAKNAVQDDHPVKGDGTSRAEEETLLQKCVDMCEIIAEYHRVRLGATAVELLQQFVLQYIQEARIGALREAEQIAARMRMEHPHFNLGDVILAIDERIKLIDQEEEPCNSTTVTDAEPSGRRPSTDQD